MAPHPEDWNDDKKKREVIKVWRAWKTLHEMVADREYELAEDEMNISLEDFWDEYIRFDSDGNVDRSMLRFSARPSETMIKKCTPPATEENPDPEPDASCGPVWVEYLKDKTLGIKQMRDFGHWLIDNKYRKGILVTHVPVSPAGRKMLAGIDARSDIEVECFLEEDLLINITQHELVPKHVLLTKDEKAALLKRYRLRETQLPRILQKDPVARYMGLKRGNVVKIIRISETAGRYASYRLCV